LVILGKQGPMRVGDLARELNVAVPSASRLLDLLAESGFVERRDDPTDRRAFLVSLTADGARILEDVRAEGTQELAGHLASLPAAQRAAVEAALPALEALVDAFSPMTDPPAPEIHRREAGGGCAARFVSGLTRPASPARCI
jgi:DNA-binding MarR family transcriptional regulator